VNPPGGGGGSDTCHPFSAISVPVGPTGPAGFFDVFVGIELSPNDLYSGNGRVDLTNVVPEPLSLGLLGLGLGAVVFFRRRRA
jgi:hypothetical protein